MIQCPDPCPGPAQFASTDVALVTYKEWLTKVVVKVLATSLGTDRSCFSCVCIAVDIAGHLCFYFSHIQKL